MTRSGFRGHSVRFKTPDFPHHIHFIIQKNNIKTTRHSKGVDGGAIRKKKRLAAHKTRLKQKTAQSPEKGTANRNVLVNTAVRESQGDEIYHIIGASSRRVLIEAPGFQAKPSAK